MRPGSASFQDLEVTEPVDAIVASTSLHHVEDLGPVLDKVAGLLRPDGTFVVLEWAWERFDERTVRWCFDRLPAADDDHHNFLRAMHDQWPDSGLGWEMFCATWANEPGHEMHRSDAILAALDERFTCSLLLDAPYFFSHLAGTSEADELAAIQAKDIEATGIRYIGRRAAATSG